MFSRDSAANTVDSSTAVKSVPFGKNCLIRIPIESFAKTMKSERMRVGKNTDSVYGLTQRRFPDGLRNEAESV